MTCCKECQHFERKIHNKTTGEFWCAEPHVWQAVDLNTPACPRYTPINYQGVTGSLARQLIDEGYFRPGVEL